MIARKGRRRKNGDRRMNRDGFLAYKKYSNKTNQWMGGRRKDGTRKERK
jgi:hypothetical protein